MHDWFSSFFGPGGEEDRIFAWLWPLCVLGYLIGFSQFGLPDLWGFEAKSFGAFLMVCCGFGTATTFALFLVSAIIARFLSWFEK